MRQPLQYILHLIFLPIATLFTALGFQSEDKAFGSNYCKCIDICFNNMVDSSQTCASFSFKTSPSWAAFPYKNRNLNLTFEMSAENLFCCVMPESCGPETSYLPTHMEEVIAQRANRRRRQLGNTETCY